LPLFFYWGRTICCPPVAVGRSIVVSALISEVDYAGSIDLMRALSVWSFGDEAVSEENVVVLIGSSSIVGVTIDD
jgi:hypothetical protein